MNYALSHVNPNSISSRCPTESTILMDTSYYDPAYQNVWSITISTCNDCTDFVSQALVAGGFTTDAYWNPQGQGTYAWNVVDPASTSDLFYYLNTTKNAIEVLSNVSLLRVGDLAYGQGHVVIITGLNPVRYSGHTNDRHNYNLSMSPTLNNYWHIKDSFSVNYTFADVYPSHWAWGFIERLYRSGITSGCDNNHYCPDYAVSRAQMAVFLLKGIHGASYNPPAVGGSTGFNDVPTNHWAAAWIKQLAAEGITGGCAAGMYCPDASVTRAQMAVFLLRSKYGASYVPPNVSSTFYDTAGHWAEDWIEQLKKDGISSGCYPAGYYCPENSVTRDQMAVFLVKTFQLP